LLARDLNPRTVLHAYAVLRVALNRAAKLQLVPRNPVLLVDPPKLATTEIHPLSPAQASQLLAAARGQRYEHLYALLAATGLRLGEAQSLRWQDINLAGGHLRVHHTLEWMHGRPWRLAEPKSARGRRVVPLIGPAVAALRAQREQQANDRRAVGADWQDHQFVFTNPVGEPVTASTVDKDFKRLLKLAGLPTNHRVHDLRHSTATYLLGAGVPERIVMEILGHSNLAMTHHYQHVLSGMLADAAARLEGWLTAPAQVSAD
jgi:integrase